MERPCGARLHALLTEAAGALVVVGQLQPVAASPAGATL
jgi:hypothetical protein